MLTIFSGHKYIQLEAGYNYNDFYDVLQITLLLTYFATYYNLVMCLPVFSWLLVQSMN